MFPRYVLLIRAAEITGYSVKALERKIESGEFVHGVHWRRAPDGHRTIDIQSFNEWVEGKRFELNAMPNQTKAHSKSKQQ